MSDPRAKFQKLLCELFQFDMADLDFGIYRIMNYKRQVIERWIEQDLPQAIREELKKGALAEQQQLAEELAAVRQEIQETAEKLGVKAFDADDNLSSFWHDKPIGQKFLALQTKAAHARPSAALEAAVYNHLYTFFSRYYQDGDFISKRRYSKKERYAIPYNGEEVYLYWANHDQYYVKTAEHFTDYTWKAPHDVTVHFKLQAADVEVINVKGEKRFFLPVLNDVAWDAETRTLTIPFQYRPLTEQEKITYGNKKQQEKIIEEALKRLPNQLKGNTEALAALAAERRKDAKGNPVSHLEHHLRQYTARNTRDFFIHKDLKGFLSRELDFYIKNEVLNLDELEAAGENLAAGWFQLMRLIKRVGYHIIDFLAQIEDFQKALWEKKKFVTETFWCVTVGHIPETFYPEIAANDAQWQEWRELLHIHELPKDLWSGDLTTKEDRIAFLKAHPSLVLDTRHFSRDFTDRLLASFENLDEMTDGLLVHSENWQALNLLLEKYRGRVQCVHIDPPYNTEASGFPYKNDYRHSSWLSMIRDRALLSLVLLSTNGTFLVHIDEYEFQRLNLLLEQIFGYVGTAIWDKLNPMMGAKALATQHEYIFFCSHEPRAFFIRPENVKKILAKAASIVLKHGKVTAGAQREFTNWVRQAPGLSGGERAYQYIDEQGRVYRLVAMTWPNPTPPPPEFFEPLIHPITGKPCPVPARGWSLSPKTMQKLIERGEIVFGPDETTQPQRKVYLSERKALSSVIRNGARGKKELESLGLDFTYSHPSSLYVTLIEAGLAGGVGGSWVLDYFAGSGTTGHAVINLNREDGGRRKFILVEMGEYFDTVLLPRIKKVTFTPEWKDGRPKRTATQEEFERGPRIVKVIRLESYEDALNNITFDEEDGQKALALFGDEYLLRYMLKWESRKSETLLDVEKLQSPFSYQLRIHRDGETREQPVDLPETFAYLIGLDVERRQVLYDGDRRYLVHRGITRDGRKVAVIWRETQGWEQVDYERDAQFVARHGLTEGADEVFVNGDSYIGGARSLDGLFKARLFGRSE